MDQWISAENLAMKIGIHSVRTVEKLLSEIQESFPVIPLQEEFVKNVFPNISVDVNVGDWQEVDGRLLSFKTPELGLFVTISKYFILFVSNI